MKILSLKHFSILSYLARDQLSLGGLVAQQRHSPAQVTVILEKNKKNYRILTILDNKM